MALNAKRETGTNVIEVMDNLKAQIEKVNEEVLGPRGWGLELFQVYDQTVYVRQSVDNAALDLLLGACLAAVVLFLTLRSIGATLVVAISIPISVIGTFLGLSLTGRNLNVISMAGLTFAIGMGVDNTIVVLENIFRHREMGKDRLARRDRRGERGVGRDPRRDAGEHRGVPAGRVHQGGGRAALPGHQHRDQHLAAAVPVRLADGDPGAGDAVPPQDARRVRRGRRRATRAHDEKSTTRLGRLTAPLGARRRRGEQARSTASRSGSRTASSGGWRWSSC